MLTEPAAESEWSFQAYCYNKLSENFRLVMSAFDFLIFILKKLSLDKFAFIEQEKTNAEANFRRKSINN